MRHELRSRKRERVLQQIKTIFQPASRRTLRDWAGQTQSRRAFPTLSDAFRCLSNACHYFPWPALPPFGELSRANSQQAPANKSKFTGKWRTQVSSAAEKCYARTSLASSPSTWRCSLASWSRPDSRATFAEVSAGKQVSARPDMPRRLLMEELFFWRRRRRCRSRRKGNNNLLLLSF